MLEELIKREADVFGDLTEQDWGNVSTLVKRYFVRRPAASRNYLCEPRWRASVKPSLVKMAHFTELEDGDIAHGSSDGDVLNPNKFGLQYGFAVFQKHCNNIMQVSVHFIQRFPLGMGAGKTGNEADEQAGLLTPLNYR